ncbi:hypothetical protein [Nocardioides mesophilus]|uniref:Uncharacterized protein n=1 Tax=Nocardioides mesophilus TaxID=433659 RepID=A0A7G9RFS7_9ACTN|nr:hypothetical protein [Nocardioides mesophilus]QNN54452.1 hypothetical protein H9L09_09125 [Nocardioides mesophilus]
MDGKGDSGREAAGSWRELLQRLRELTDPQIRWMRMPPGHRALSKVHRSNDVVLKHFHEPLDLVVLDLLPGRGSRQLLRRGLREVPPTDRDSDSDERKLNVWLEVRSPEPSADVRIGADLLGSTTLPRHAWEALTAEATRGVFADGLLELTRDPRDGGPVLRRLRCYLPSDPAGK